MLRIGMKNAWYETDSDNQQSSLLSQKLRAGISMMRSLSLTVQRHAMPPDEYAHLCEVRESRFYLDHANYTQKSRTPDRGIDFPCSVFNASVSYRAAATGTSNVRSIKREYVFLARYCFLRILARFGTRSIQFGRLWPVGVLESPRAVQSNGAFWSMRTGNCVLFAGTRLTNDDDHLHRSPLFIHMNETLNLLTVQLLLFRYRKSSIDPHEILHSGSVLPAPTIALIICHSRHFAPSLFFWRCNVIRSRIILMKYSLNFTWYSLQNIFFSQNAAFLTRRVLLDQSLIRARSNIVLQGRMEIIIKKNRICCLIINL